MMTRHFYSNPSSASDWSGSREIRNTTQICVMTRHQYGISAVAFSRGNQYAGVAKCRLFPQATQVGKFSLVITNYIISSSYFIRYNAGNKFVHSHKGRLVCDWLSEPKIILIDLEVPPALSGTSGRLGEQECSH